MAEFDLRNTTPETKGDLAVFLIAGTAGYLLDAGLNIVGFLEPAVCGPLFATGALGLRKAIESSTDRFNAERRKDAAVFKELSSVRQLITFLSEKGDDPKALVELENLIGVARIRDYDQKQIRQRVDDILKRHQIPY